MDVNVGYEANDSGSKHSSGVYLSYFILHSKVGLKLFVMVTGLSGVQFGL